MDVEAAIRTRRSVPAVSDRRPERAEVAAILDLAVLAPTHHLTQPWRFIVLTGDALPALGAVMGERIRRETPDDPRLEDKVAAEAARPMRAPVVIVVVYTPSQHPKALQDEDRAGVAAATQNLLLAAHARGLGAFWRTGPAALDPAVAAHLGLAAGPPPEEILGFIYLGYPAQEPPPAKPRASAAERTTWLGWE